MSVHKIQVKASTELDEVARKLLLWSNGQLVWLFEGNMGTGKTTLIRHICQQLGAVSTVQSPTFSIVNEYRTAQAIPIFHFDLYRLKDDAEVRDIGFEEYLEYGGYCFIEWPEVARNLWPDRYFHVHLALDENGLRIITSRENTY